MESLISFLLENAHHAHYYIFCLLMLAGLNVPISEDLMIIISATIAATIVPENTYLLFLGVFLGAYLSDWVAYYIGRKFGRKLWKFKWFSKTIPEKKLIQTQNYYEKYGFLTLLIGRFIPFGVRNCLFMAAGMGKMHFGKFILSDGIACIISNAALFSLSYYCGKNYQTLAAFIKNFNIVIFFLFIASLSGFIWYKKTQKKRMLDI